MSRAPFTPAWSLTLWIDDQGHVRGQQLRHHGQPRFSCRAVLDEGDGPCRPLDLDPASKPDLLTGVVWAGADWMLCEFVWDEPPPGDDAAYRALMHAAESVLDLAEAATMAVDDE